MMEQTVEPSPLNVPVMHGKHILLFAAALYVFEGQMTQGDVPSALPYPAAQIHEI